MQNKILLLDIETTSLNANRGHILCWGAKWLGSKDIITWRIDNARGYGTSPDSWSNDSDGVRRLIALAEKASAVVAYYGGYGKFDIPFLNTRALANGLQPSTQLSIIDPYTTAKAKLKLERYSLGSVAEALRTKYQKTHLPWGDWEKAKYGDRKAMSKLVSYCENDIKVLEEVYKKLLPVNNAHPYTAARVVPKTIRHTQCPACGSTHTHGKGYRYTSQYQIHRRQCQNCRHNFQGKRVKI